METSVALQKILIVEDEQPIRDGLRQKLESEGYRVTAVENVADGILALEGGPDLVILDRRLPDGEGLDVLRTARGSGLSLTNCSCCNWACKASGVNGRLIRVFHYRQMRTRWPNSITRCPTSIRARKNG